MTLVDKKAWYVLHVKPRTEKKVMEYINAYKYFGYLPMYTKIIKVQRRKVKRDIPCFPGYVFTKLFPEERLNILKTNYIVRTIPVSQPRRMIHQLRQISRASRNAPDLKPVDICQVGDYVKVVSGPLYGIEGYVTRRGGDAKLCLNIDILGSAIEVTISSCDIIKVRNKYAKE